MFRYGMTGREKKNSVPFPGSDDSGQLLCSSRMPQARPLWTSECPGGSSLWQFKPERTSFTLVTFQTNPAAMGFHSQLAERQTQTGRISFTLLA